MPKTGILFCDTLVEPNFSLSSLIGASLAKRKRLPLSATIYFHAQEYFWTTKIVLPTAEKLHESYLKTERLKVDYVWQTSGEVPSHQCKLPVRDKIN